MTADIVILKSDSHLPKKLAICSIKNPLKMIKNAFYFILKALFVFKILKFLSPRFVMYEKQLDQKEKVYFKIDDVATWFTNNCNTHIVQHLIKQRQPDNEIWSFN